MNQTRLPNINWDPRNPPKEVLTDEMQLALEHLKSFIKPDMEEVPAHLILLGIRLDNAAVVRMCVLIATIDEHRHEMMRRIGEQYAKIYIPISAVFIVPTWVSSMTEERLKAEGHIQPSKDPQRTEAVMVSGALFNKQTSTVMLPAYRAEDGCVRVALGEAQTSSDAEPYILYRFFEGAALALKDYKLNKPTNE